MKRGLKAIAVWIYSVPNKDISMKRGLKDYELEDLKRRSSQQLDEKRIERYF